MSRGIVLAAPASDSGKTVLCAGLLAHLRAHGHAVRAFKAGPDYIDPGYHRLATGHDCVNLDPWAMRPATLARRVLRCAAPRIAFGVIAVRLCGRVKLSTDEVDPAAESRSNFEASAHDRNIPLDWARGLATRTGTKS